MDNNNLCLYTWTDSLLPTVLAGHGVISLPCRQKRAGKWMSKFTQTRAREKLINTDLYSSLHCCTLENTGDQVTGTALCVALCTFKLSRSRSSGTRIRLWLLGYLEQRKGISLDVPEYG